MIIKEWKTPRYPRLVDYDEYQKRDPNIIQVGPGVTYDQHEVRKTRVMFGFHEVNQYDYIVNGQIIETQYEEI